MIAGRPSRLVLLRLRIYLYSTVHADCFSLPMPDGFTFSSLALYDEQITRIASRYTLKGVNVLVHCRGQSKLRRF